MSIDIEMTGSGTLGPITPGWSVQESATPTTIGESASTSGSVSFTAATRDDSLLTINNYITTTHPDLGHVDGIVKSVSQQGLSTNITHSNLLANYDGERDIPGMFEGCTYSAIDLITQLAKQEVRLKSGLTGTFFSLQGHNSGFDSDGNLVEGSVSSNPDGLLWKSVSGTTYTSYIPNSDNYIDAFDSSWAATNPISNNPIFYSGYVYANNFSADPSSRKNVLTFKTLNTGDGFYAQNFSFKGHSNTVTLSGSLGQSFFEFDKANSRIYLYIEYVAAGVYTKFEDYINLSALDWSKEMTVFFEFTSSDGIFYPGVGYKYDYKISVCNSDNYSNVVTYTKTVGVDNFCLAFQRVVFGKSLYGSVPGTVGRQGVKSIWLRNDNTPVLIQEYENEQNFVCTDAYSSGVLNISRPHPIKQNMWQWIQDACSTYGSEIYINNGILTIANIGERILDISNIVSPLSITPNSTLSGKSVDVAYRSPSLNYVTTSQFISVPVYDSYLDNNRIFKVNVGEVLNVTVETDYALSSVLSPQPVSTTPTVGGQYTVSDANGFPAWYGWYTAGGRVFASLNKDNKNAIDIKVVAPAAAYGGYTPPYSLSVSSGGKEYSALKISGAGYLNDKKILSLQTGATAEKTPQDVSKTIDNTFITTIEQAYDSGIHASLDASGPRVTVSGTIPTSNIDGFGLTPGSMFRYKDSIYRVTDCTIGDVAVSFNAVRYVTVADFDAVWSGKTVAQHDGVWGTNDVSDQIIMPLYQPL